MSIEIKVPVLPESVSDATIAAWHKNPGDFVKRDEHLVDIETDKVVLEVVAPSDGILETILKPVGSTVQAQEIIALFKDGAATQPFVLDEEAASTFAPTSSVTAPGGKKASPAAPAAQATPTIPAVAQGTPTPQPAAAVTPAAPATKPETENLSPAARRLATEQGVDIANVQGSGKGGRITTGDISKSVKTGKEKLANVVLSAQVFPVAKPTAAPAGSTASTGSTATAGTTQTAQSQPSQSQATQSQTASSQASVPKTAQSQTTSPPIRAVAPMFAEMGAELGSRLEKRVPMTRLRARIAERLVQAQHTAAILTTFNEVNMANIIELRKKYKEVFEKTYGVRLGLMSFFTLAVIEALKHFPVVNASIDGNDIVYHGYYDIGIAVSSPRGLVVPILRNAETMTMDEIERQISQLAKKAETGQLSMEEITGGTFTITNGGVFGSLMATPILNPPQSGILGMHKIEERPIVENGEIVIRPMMYVALSYDHRIIDGAESVRFLVTVKELLEEPARLALGI